MSSDNIEDELAEEAAELDGYFSDASLQPEPDYPPLNTRFESAVVVANLPQVPESKVEKLTKVVVKLVSKIGTLVSNRENENDGDEDNAANSTEFNGVMMPFDSGKGTTLGFCLVEYATPDEAKNAVEVLQGYMFDKNHALSVTLYEQAKKLATLGTDNFVVPELPPFEEKPNAMEWLEDANQRDQYVVRHGKETVVNWFDAKNDPVVDYDGAREKEAGVVWCEYYCFWSPKGSYLATLVPGRGVILWSGSNYDRAGRFVHPDVTRIVFSPQENYLVAMNDNPANTKDPAAVKVYHIPTGKLLRAFPLYPDHLNPDNKKGGAAASRGEGLMDNEPEPPQPPPPFVWSHDDKYLARIGDGLISIFETPRMRLLDKRSLAAEGVKEFQWSPKANVLAYWVRTVRNFVVCRSLDVFFCCVVFYCIFVLRLCLFLIRSFLLH